MILMHAITGSFGPLMPDGKTPPSEFRIFCFGENDTSKGIFTLTREDATKIVAERARQNKGEVNLDYDHLGATQPMIAGEAKASGWCNVEIRDDGLWAVNVRWTPKAQQMLRDAEYRFFSPAFKVEGKRIVSLGNIALVNQPAMMDIQPLVAASKEKAMKFSAMLGKYMKDQSCSEKELAALSKLPWEKVSKLSKGEDEPTQEEMSALASALKFSKDDLTECAVDNEDDDDVDDAEKKKAAKKASVLAASAAAVETVTATIGTDDLVKLTGSADPKTQAAIIAAWKETATMNASQMTLMTKQFEDLKKQSDDQKRNQLIERGRAEGKLSNPLIRLYASKSVEEFEQFLSVAPVIFNKEILSVPEASSGPVLLTRAEIEVCEATCRSTAKLAEYIQASREKQEKWVDDSMVDGAILAEYTKHA